jgi:hypothetical protein
MLAQQIAMQQANAAAAQGNNNPGQPNPMNPQAQSIQNVQMAAAQQQQAQQQQQQQQQQAQQQAQQQQAAAAAQQAQQSQPQPQAQQPQPPQQQAQQQATPQQQQAAATTAAMMQTRSRDQIKGHYILLLKQFGDHLSLFASTSKPLETYMATGKQRLEALGEKQKDDLNYWANFVDRFFSPAGIFRHCVWVYGVENESKQYEITVPALARYFYTHFESGVQNMQLIMEKGSEKELPNNSYYLESSKSSFIYWFDNGSQVNHEMVLIVSTCANKSLAGCHRYSQGPIRLQPKNRMA